MPLKKALSYFESCTLIILSFCFSVFVIPFFYLVHFNCLVVDQFVYFGINISSTENNVDICIRKA